MKVSLNWIQEHIDIEGSGVDEIAQFLTQAGIEVEGIETVGVGSEKVVVAQIEEVEPHPNADRLKVCQVNAGEKELRQIVCGAKNYKIGDKVPCALPGAKLGEWTIGETKMRGVASLGMLCAAEEIGLPKGEDGLLILPEDLETGKALQKLFPSDTVLDIEVTPNRPDLLSHYGIARELSALMGKKLKQLAQTSLQSTPAGSQVSLVEERNCSFYSIRRIKGVKVLKSPEWLREKLNSIGLKPINNVVDVTNYVLHNVGQPLHAFDASKIEGEIQIRNAKSSEEFQALDGKSYQLKEGDCTISDQKGEVLALAGVMGGEQSQVTEQTQDIILESAWFEPTSIRATSRHLNLSSDSSYRFERRVDPEMVLRASELATQLITELAGGEAEESILTAGNLPCESLEIKLENSLLDEITTSSIPQEEGNAILKKLGLEEGAVANDHKTWKVPGYRPDLSRPVDLIEEIVRVVGISRIPSRNKACFSPEGKVNRYHDVVRTLKERLVSLGFYEAKTIKLISQKQLEDCLPLKPLKKEDLINLALPLSEDHTLLRPSLIPGLIATATRNINQGASRTAFFEEGVCFRHFGGGKAKNREEKRIGIILGGQNAPLGWATQQRSLDGYDLKAVIEHLIPSVKFQLKESDIPSYVLGAHIELNGTRCGVVGRISPARSRALSFPEECWVAEFDLKKVVELISLPRKATELPQFPGSTRDAAMEVPLELSYQQIETVLSKFKDPILAEAHLFDVFSDPTGEQLSADAKSLAYRFLYRSKEKTLKNKEIDAVHQKLLEHLKASLPLTLR